MLAIRMKFLAGRFHATPWGHHVNEGAVEYPPSVWRLLRALTATFYRVHPERAHENDATVIQLKSILGKLSAPPEYVLPQAAVAHTRHYDQANGGVKFFDTFVSVAPDDGLLWLWREVELSISERQALAELLAALGTFGRAESWCEAELVNLAEMPSNINSQPFADEINLAGKETMRLLSPASTANIEEMFRTLLTETGEMRRRKQLEPTGTQWVTYTRPSNILRPRRTQPHREKSMKEYTVARYALSSTVLPLVTEAMPLAEKARSRLSKCRAGTSYSPALCGKDETGRPLAGHVHAHFLVTDEDGDGKLDHLTIYAPCGFNRHDVEALGQLDLVKGERNRPDVQTVLLGLGRREDFAASLIFREARRWRSVTPFSLPRFATRGAGKPPRKRDEPLAQLLRELNHRGLPAPVSVLSLEGYATMRRPKMRWLEFHTRRLRKAADDYGVAEGFGLAGFELEFAQPVRGPITVGFGAHFGLGLFLPVD